ncbi:hypothetical protein [Kiloniella sp. b19]|uniref:hypothetical protein n=1 Tax=Kiloniella sp. GXU_MW_B19 TaxID=3141326 RepID=UPI0031D07FAA
MLSARRFFRLFLKATLIAGITGFATLMIGRHIMISKAGEKADQIIQALELENADDLSDQDFTHLTRLVFDNFEQTTHSNYPEIIAARFVTNHRLPDWIRLPNGVMEMLFNRGECNNAASQLTFVLKQLGYKSRQWDMVAEGGGHSALILERDNGDQLFLDPFFGLVAVDTEAGQLISPAHAQQLIRKGQHPDEVFRLLSDGSDASFYQSFASVKMAAQGDNLILDYSLPALHGQTITIGQLDSSIADIMSGGSNNNISAYWHYVGHRYSREWVRKLKAQDDLILEISLIQDATDNILTASPAPSVEGKTLSWSLKKGEEITFTDGEAKLSLSRLNSYLDVDRIVISPR